MMVTNQELQVIQRFNEYCNYDENIKGNDLGVGCTEMFESACEEGDLDIVKKIYQMYGEYIYLDEDCVSNAVYKNRIDVVQWLWTIKQFSWYDFYQINECIKQGYMELYDWFKQKLERKEYIQDMCVVCYDTKTCFKMPCCSQPLCNQCESQIQSPNCVYCRQHNTKCYKIDNECYKFNRAGELHTCSRDEEEEEEEIVF